MGLVTVPRRIYVVAISSEGTTPLNALDACLVKAGLPQVSLIKITSILPPNVEVVNSPPQLPLGSNIPAVYTYVTSSKRGQRLSAAIAVGFTDTLTLVAEHSDVDIDEESARGVVERMVREMAIVRGLQIRNILIKSTTHIVRNVGCALAMVAEVE